jgi:hypothetical protein
VSRVFHLRDGCPIVEAINSGVIRIFT